MNTKSFALIVIALCVAQFFLGMMYGPQAALRRDVQRAGALLGASIGYQGASVLRAGSRRSSWSLLEATGTSLSVSFYVLAMSIITFVSVYLITATYGDEMTRDQAGATEEEGGGQDVDPADGKNLSACPSRSRGAPSWKEERLYETILYEKNGGVATIALNRPERLNAFDGKMHEEIHDALDPPPRTRRSAAWCCGARDGVLRGGGPQERGPEPRRR